jgi:hypothetical protein
MSARVIPFPLHPSRQPTMEVPRPVLVRTTVAPKGEVPSLRTTRLAALGPIRIVGTARTISRQLAEIAERVSGMVPGWQP